MTEEPQLLQRILSELSKIEGLVTAMVADVATLKANNDVHVTVASEVRELRGRMDKVELVAAKWDGAAGASSAVGKWVAGILAGLITSGLVAAVTYLIASRH